MHDMTADAFVQCRVTSETKDRFARAAQLQGISESALLKRFIEATVVATDGMIKEREVPEEPVGKGGRLSVRLQADDLIMLRQRAAVRDMPASTYVSFLIRSHLRNVAPMPIAELTALKQSIGEIGAIGRNINQIARAMNRGETASGLTRAEVQALIKALTAHKDRMKAVIAANLASWKDGYEKTIG
jgi:hypothetical protein